MTANPTVGGQYTQDSLLYRVDSVSAQLTVPAGAFAGCLQLTCIDDAWPDEQEYYGPCVGLLKLFDSEGGYELTSVSGIATCGKPGAAVLLTPPNGASFTNRFPQLSWAQTDPAADWFHLYVTLNGTKCVDQWLQGTTNWTPTAALAAGSYSWTVAAYNGAGLGPWSTSYTFTIPACVPRPSSRPSRPAAARTLRRPSATPGRPTRARSGISCMSPRMANCSWTSGLR